LALVHRNGLVHATQRNQRS